MLLVLLAGTALTAGGLGYWLGYRQVLTDSRSSFELSERLAQQQIKSEQAQTALVDARLSAQVQGDAANALRRDLASARQRNAKLQEELTFYKSLMAPGSLAEGLQIAELEIIPTEQSRTFDFELLLTQVALRRSFIAGEARVDVIAQSGQDPVQMPPGVISSSGTEVVLPLTELSDPEKYPLRFRFRYFQDIAGRLTLPDGVTPLRVRVTAVQKGKEAIEMEFPWPQL